MLLGGGRRGYCWAGRSGEQKKHQRTTRNPAQATSWFQPGLRWDKIMRQQRPVEDLVEIDYPPKVRGTKQNQLRSTKWQYVLFGLHDSSYSFMWRREWYVTDWYDLMCSYKTISAAIWGRAIKAQPFGLLQSLLKTPWPEFNLVSDTVTETILMKS